MAATLDELVETGYGALSVQQVAARAGVNKTSVYRRWGTKGALLAAALLDDLDDVPAEDRGSLPADLMDLWSTAPGRGRPRRAAHVIAVSRALDAATGDPEVDAVREELWSRRLAHMRAIVRRAIRRGELPAGTKPEVMLDLLFGAFHLHVVTRARPAAPAYTALLTRTVLTGLGYRPRPAEGGD